MVDRVENRLNWLRGTFLQHNLFCFHGLQENNSIKIRGRVFRVTAVTGEASCLRAIQFTASAFFF